MAHETRVRADAAERVRASRLADAADATADAVAPAQETEAANQGRKGSRTVAQRAKVTVQLPPHYWRCPPENASKGRLGLKVRMVMVQWRE